MLAFLYAVALTIACLSKKKNACPGKFVFPRYCGKKSKISWVGVILPPDLFVLVVEIDGDSLDRFGIYKTNCMPI